MTAQTGNQRDDVTQRLRTLDSCAVSDAMDIVKLSGAVVGLAPQWPVRGVTAGRVRTVKAAPKTAAGPTTHIASPLVASGRVGDVVVIDNDGRTDVSSWGGLLAEASVRNGITGVIVDGACRDVLDNERLGLPVFARATVAVSARGRIVQQDMDVDITIGGVAVSPGDLVIADRNGVVFIPAARAEEVVDIAAALTRREEAMAVEVRSGRSIVEVMHDSSFDLKNVVNK